MKGGYYDYYGGRCVVTLRFVDRQKNRLEIPICFFERWVQATIEKLRYRKALSGGTGKRDADGNPGGARSQRGHATEVHSQRQDGEREHEWAGHKDEGGCSAALFFNRTFNLKLAL